ncbi:unnamed protein product (macronuclear) [Paramecium tetraurelia]|uniref:Uncharacterized protein n=1 Tax=Paramecium tetraurelia TaxID=5888 RepID=A0C1D8_PARTE|nr:uncharacterized protein GSPATT00034081001 [Paramecium tetraurelia]CAK64605.1 unnamed protein product [Paramecium tetraurelia]|eukprot:XP_001432003.1 hypothetical protein (macronuclear) [Paramecium tetraurelia strain d4-2]
MKTKFIITIIAVLQLEIVSGLSINDPDCMKYLWKFGYFNYSEGLGPLKVAFTGDVSFITGTNNAKVSLRYSDADLFNDPIYFGLTKEDGKTEDQVCLDLKLWRYTSNKYSDPLKVTDLTIIPSNNSEKQWRYYSFIIPQNEFKIKLVETSNSDQFIYTGYYALTFYATGTDQLQYTFFFELSLSIDRTKGTAFESLFKPLSIFYQACHGRSDCIQHDTQLKWCTDLKCTAYATPDLHFKDEFILQQVTTTPGIQGYYLTKTEVWYTGKGLLKKASPISINNKIRGQVIISLKAEIVWTEVTIKVISTLSILQSERKRVRGQTEFDKVSGESQQIECIKAQGSDTCVTCEQELEINGFAHDGCQLPQSQEQMGFIFWGIVLILIIIFLNLSEIKSYIL